MDIFPAIDLRNGKCVRLLQGDYNRQIDYRDDPVAQAKDFEQLGARWLHVVDLDGARDGTPANAPVIEKIAAATNLNIEVGGGIREESTVLRLLDIGVKHVVIGTGALKDPQWFESLVKDTRFAHHIVLGLDARDGKIATDGWTETSQTSAVELAQRVNDWPLAAIVYTDIARDGMLTGPNVAATAELARQCSIPVIASGGVGNIEHVRQLSKLPLMGIIIGRALYEEKLNLADALKIVK